MLCVVEESLDYFHAAATETGRWEGSRLKLRLCAPYISLNHNQPPENRPLPVSGMCQPCPAPTACKGSSFSFSGLDWVSSATPLPRVTLPQKKHWAAECISGIVSPGAASSPWGVNNL